MKTVVMGVAVIVICSCLFFYLFLGQRTGDPKPNALENQSSLTNYELLSMATAIYEKFLAGDLTVKVTCCTKNYITDGNLDIMSIDAPLCWSKKEIQFYDKQILKVLFIGRNTGGLVQSLCTYEVADNQLLINNIE